MNCNCNQKVGFEIFNKVHLLVFEFDMNLLLNWVAEISTDLKLK